MHHTTNTHAADQLRRIQSQLTELQNKEHAIRSQLSSATSRAAVEINPSDGAQSQQSIASQPLHILTREALVLESGSQYVGKLEASSKCIFHLLANLLLLCSTAWCV